MTQIRLSRLVSDSVADDTFGQLMYRVLLAWSFCAFIALCCQYWDLDATCMLPLCAIIVTCGEHCNADDTCMYISVPL